MLDGSRYFAEFPDENPDRVPMNPTVLCALVALEREISRIVQSEPQTAPQTAPESEPATKVEAADGCDS